MTAPYRVVRDRDDDRLARVWRGICLVTPVPIKVERAEFIAKVGNAEAERADELLAMLDRVSDALADCDCGSSAGLLRETEALLAKVKP